MSMLISCFPAYALTNLTAKVGDNAIVFINPADPRFHEYGSFEFHKQAFGGQYPIYQPFYIGNTAGDAGWVNYILENRQTAYGYNNPHLAPVGNPNVAKGKQDPVTGEYKGDETGGAYVSIFGNGWHKYEFRHAGYTANGTVVSNPWFPDDKPRTRNDYWNLPWLNNQWTQSNMGRTEYNLKPEVAKANIEVLFKAYPQFKTVNPDWRYWNEVFKIQTDARTEAGLFTGWHTRDNMLWYRTIVIPRLQPNIAIVEMKVKDQTGKVLVRHYRGITNWIEGQPQYDAWGKYEYPNGQPYPKGSSPNRSCHSCTKSRCITTSSWTW